MSSEEISYICLRFGSLATFSTSLILGILVNYFDKFSEFVSNFKIRVVTSTFIILVLIFALDYIIKVSISDWIYLSIFGLFVLAYIFYNAIAILKVILAIHEVDIREFILWSIIMVTSAPVTLTVMVIFIIEFEILFIS